MTDGDIFSLHHCARSIILNFADARTNLSPIVRTSCLICASVHHNLKPNSSQLSSVSNNVCVHDTRCKIMKLDVPAHRSALRIYFLKAFSCSSICRPRPVENIYSKPP